MSMSTDGMTLRGENEALREINKSCHFIWHNSLAECFWIVLKPLRWENGSLISWEISFKTPMKTGWKHGRLWLFSAFISLRWSLRFAYYWLDFPVKYLHRAVIMKLQQKSGLPFKSIKLNSRY